MVGRKEGKAFLRETYTVTEAKDAGKKEELQKEREGKEIQVRNRNNHQAVWPFHTHHHTFLLNVVTIVRFPLLPFVYQSYK